MTVHSSVNEESLERQRAETAARIDEVYKASYGAHNSSLLSEDIKTRQSELHYMVEQERPSMSQDGIPTVIETGIDKTIFMSLFTGPA
jgi:hypothetical protein